MPEPRIPKTALTDPLAAAGVIGSVGARVLYAAPPDFKIVGAVPMAAMGVMLTALGTCYPDARAVAATGGFGIALGQRVDVELVKDDDPIDELEALLADARRALDEIRPVVEHVDDDVTYDGSWGEILMDGIKRIEAERDRLVAATAAVRELALNPQTINAAAGGGNLVTQVRVVYPENIFAALEGRDDDGS